MHAIHTFGTEEQRESWLRGMAAGELIGSFALTEPDVGSNPTEMKTFARLDGSDWVLSGDKAWVTNGTVADVSIVGVNTDQGIRGFLVPMSTAGIEVVEVANKMSLRASSTAHLRLNDVRLPVV